MPTWFRVLLSLAMLGHGVAHLPGFLAAWHLRTFPEISNTRTVLGGAVDVGVLGERLMGLAWLLAALTWVVVACGAALRAAWWLPVAPWILGASLLLCVLGWPASRIGIAQNVILAALLWGALRLGWR
jgi:hypothetical protein